MQQHYWLKEIPLSQLKPAEGQKRLNYETIRTQGPRIAALEKGRKSPEILGRKFESGREQRRAKKCSRNVEQKF
jgi:hypothetical protein